MTCYAIKGVQSEVGSKFRRSGLILLHEEEFKRGTLCVRKGIAGATDMVSIETTPFVLLQGDGLRRGILRQIVTGGTLGGDDGLTPSDSEILIRDDGDNRLINPTITALKIQQVAGDINGVLTIHHGLWHASVGAHLQWVEDERAEAIEAILRLEVAEADAAVRELGSFGHAFSRDEILAGRVAGDATQRVEQFAAAGAVHVHDLRRGFGGRLRLQRGEIVFDGDEGLIVGLRQYLRHDCARVDGRWISDELTEPLGADALSDRRERRTAHGGQASLATVAVNATELVVKQPAAFGRRCRRMEALKTGDERFGAQRGGAEQDYEAQYHAVSRMHFST